MKKNTKAALKSIVKECLIELLAEGLSDTETINESKSLKSTFNKVSNNNISSNSNKRYLNDIKKDIDNSKTFNEDRISETVSKITKDDVMSQILADTARTTLVAQGNSASGANIMTAGDAAAKASLQSDPMELFSESAGKWANLAFSGPLGKK
tara:strand:- start:768 stop:1226 length:459 start_codon:yes stop_codon:yes gene_type:complete